MKRKQIELLLCALLVFFGTGAFSQNNDRTSIIVGLNGQSIQKLALTFDPFSASGPTNLRLMMTSPSSPSQFLGPEARYYISLSSWQLWALLHPEVLDKNGLPVDRVEHDNVEGILTVDYLSGQEVISRTVIAANMPVGDFSPPTYNDEVTPIKLIYPGEIVYRTEALAVPANLAVDKISISLQAQERSTGRRSMRHITASQTLVLQGDPVHIYASGQMFVDPIPFVILDSQSIKSGKTTKFIYSNERPTAYLTHYNSVAGAYAFPSFMAELNGTILCHDRTGQRPPIHADLGLLKTKAAYLYRVDGGSWSSPLPMNANFDEVKPVIFPYIWESLSSFTLPPFEVGQVVEIAFQMQPGIDVDARNDCLAQGGTNFERHYPQGYLLPMKPRLETPSNDLSSGYRFEVK